MAHPAEAIKLGVGPSAREFLNSLRNHGRQLITSGYALPAGIVAIGVIACFWPLFAYLPTIWGSKDGYYSHGPLVPLIAGYVIYRRMPAIVQVRPSPGWLSLPVLIVLLLLVRGAFASEMWSILSLAFVLTLLSCVWLVLGIRLAVLLSPGILYLLFGLPIFGSTIEIYTNPLQAISTSAAYKMLQLAGMEPVREAGNTTIWLNHYVLDVGVPCSGLKLLVALSAFTVFFILIANLKAWSNFLLLLLVFPLAIMINGLRIALIGLVGETWGAAAGHEFHDWSGYITLVLCFVILFRIVRWLGWKG